MEMAYDKKPPFEITLSEARIKGAAFCAYQERTQQQVREKLYSLGLKTVAVEEVIAYLITENYINEERFAKAFAGGKFRIKNWGRNKIKQALKQHGLSVYCIKKGLEEIGDEAYLEAIRALADKKSSHIQEKDTFKKAYKIAAYLIGKGFEADLVWDVLNKR